MYRGNLIAAPVIPNGGLHAHAPTRYHRIEVNDKNSKKQKPTQWAALGFDRKVASSSGKAIFGSADFEVDKSAQNKDYGQFQSAFLTKKRAQLFADSEPENDDLYTHTEKTLRNRFYTGTTGTTALDATPGHSLNYNNLATIQSVYVYTYSTPCFRGCSRNISLNNFIFCTSYSEHTRSIDYMLSIQW